MYRFTQIVEDRCRYVVVYSRGMLMWTSGNYERSPKKKLKSKPGIFFINIDTIHSICTFWIFCYSLLKVIKLSAGFLCWFENFARWNATSMEKMAVRTSRCIQKRKKIFFLKFKIKESQLNFCFKFVLG